MNSVVSKDGTSIGFSRLGRGPAVILVDGALCYRDLGLSGPLARLLEPKFTVYTYDRRGRGRSGDTQPYSVEREVEDIDSLVREAGGSAFLYGISSGAALGLEAASRLKGIRKLALYEPPFITDGSRQPLPGDTLETLSRMIAAGRRGDAVRLFMKFLGTPDFFVTFMSLSPAWPKLKAIAHTILYDLAIVGDYQRGKPLPEGSWSSIKVPVIIMEGEKSPAWIKNSIDAFMAIHHGGQRRILKGQTHDVRPDILGPVLADFFENAR